MADGERSRKWADLFRRISPDDLRTSRQSTGVDIADALIADVLARRIGASRQFAADRDDVTESVIANVLARRTGRDAIVDVKDYERRLERAYDSLNQRHMFSVGQLVRWKPDLRNALRPRYNEPAIIVSLIDPPVFDGTSDSGSPYFRRPLDIVLGILDDEDEFLTYYFESQRFEPYPP